MTKRLMLMLFIATVLIGGQLGLGFWWGWWIPWEAVIGQTRTASPTLTEEPVRQEPTPTLPAQKGEAQATPTAVPEAGEAPVLIPTPTPAAIRFKAIVVPLQVELKTAPQPDAPGVAQLQDGKVLELVGRTEPPAWVQVVYPPDSEGRAWIPADQLRVYNDVTSLPVVATTSGTLAGEGSSGHPTGQPTATPAPEGLTARITVEVLNVRAGPGTAYAILGKLRLGERVRVVGRDEQGSWLQVVYDEARDLRGWIFALYAEANGEGSQAPVIVLPTPQAQAAPAQESRFSGQLAILTESGGDLYLVNADGSELHTITDGVLDPALSPDGTQLAYARWTGGPYPEGIYVRDLTTDAERRQWGAHLPRTPDWSPDGRALVFSFQLGGQEGYAELERPSGSVELPPDPDWHLGYVDTWTGVYQDVPALLQSQNPSWAPDGVRIVYGGDPGLEMTSLSGTSQALSQDRRNENPVWSPAGGWIVFEVRFQDHIDLFVMGEDGSDVRALTQPDPLLDRAVNNASPTWSPDGQWIAFLTDRRGQWEVYVMRPDGSEQQPLFPDGLPGVTIRHQSAGERLLSWSL